MGILLDKNTKVLVQAITGREGSFHSSLMLEYGTNIVAGVTPGKEGQKVHGVPVFGDVASAVGQTGAEASVMFVPARFTKTAVEEAIAAGIKLVVIITEGIPTQDMIEVVNKAKAAGVIIIGPNCPGLATVGQAKMGIIPAEIFLKGKIGMVSRSGTLTYEIVSQLTNENLGQSTCVGIGGDPILGSRFIDILKLFEQDPETEAVVLIGEIGGSDEEEAASFIKSKMKKPVVGFISGKTAPKGKRMGHAGAIISGNQGTFSSKYKALAAAGVFMADAPGQIPSLVKKALGV
jgi:succinyl-CoA synthetase alpha subunit